MQTFLPYADFETTFSILDYRRLGKQRVEGWQILNILVLNISNRWANHPAVLMWQGSELLLSHYVVLCCNEWLKRGYTDNMLSILYSFIATNYHKLGQNIPTWLGTTEFHRAHKSNLIRKLPSYYSKLWPNVPNNLPYIWPTKKM